ncbi:hypothetical protein CBS101457_002291 [Exobasidium rhododendri]|nr:hypothetical protein CBS101457_002291 [Exobasidium rhododendri]
MSELYCLGAAVLDDVLSQSGSLKGLVMAKTRNSKVDAKTLLALTANTLSYHRALCVVLENAELLTLEKKAFSPTSIGKDFTGKSLALVLAHDLLLAPRGRIGTSAAWPPKAAITRHTTRLKAELTKLQIKEGKDTVQELRAGEATKRRAERIPRWVRVNERVTTIEAVIDALKQEGWIQIVESHHLLPKKRVFAQSSHLAMLLAFHPSQTSHLLGHDLYKNGHLILQDLASCFPAEILLRPEIQTKQALHVLDATAAPGNKTTHLSALLHVRKSESKITALEQSPDRYKTLVQQLKKAGSLRHDSAGAVKAIQCDFTKQKGEDYSEVTHMLLDPSCSGSGILSRLDYLTNSNDEEAEQTEEKEEKEQERLRNLAAFQGNMILHAMQFPGLRRFVYSTCSIHHEENESVVMKALGSEVAKIRGWKLAPRREVLPSWPTRGLVEHSNGQKDLAESMIRCIPGGVEGKGEGGEKTQNELGAVDLEATNGFFLTCFVRNSNNNAKNKKRNLRAREKAKGAKRARTDKGEVSERDEE